MEQHGDQDMRARESDMEVEESNVQEPTPEITSESSKDQKGVKRSADVSAEDLEQELREEVRDIEYIQGLQWTETATPLWIVASRAHESDLTSPAFYTMSVNSIKFDPNKEHVSTRIKLGGSYVLIWKPDEVIDDSSLESLSPELGYQGMVEEVNNMEACKAGRLADGYEIQSLKKRYPHARIIPSRWVSAWKSASRVRCRIVAKDLHSGVSARALGISSPTPAAEALHLVLTISANRQFRLRSLDISHAFMHSPLPKGSLIALKLPQSVSLESGEPAFLILERSLNGLRDASLHWLQLLSSTIKVLGMTADETEPCLYQGRIQDHKGREIGSSILLVYVDDILIGCSNQETEEVITKAIAAVVPVKVTGQILPGSEGGGELDFLGRKIYKTPQADRLALYVLPTYMDSSFEEYGIKRGSQAAPDVAAQLEKTDEVSSMKLSPEAYERFRRCLGRLLWLSQSRQELKLWLSLIGVKQADPTQATEAALRAVLRYLMGHRQVSLVFPSPQLPNDHVGEDLLSMHIHGYCDASHGPYRFNMRKSISGEVLMFERGLIRTAAKQQQPVALSSREAETYALQSACQSAVGLAKLVKRVMIGLGEASESDQVQTVMLTDSASAQQLIQGVDIPRRSRHIEIRLSWLQSKIAEQQIQLRFIPGVSNAADMYTKCLSTTLMDKYVSWLGFEEISGPSRDLHLLNQTIDVRDAYPFVFIEICCERNSQLRLACKTSKIPYIGITSDVQSKALQRRVCELMRQHHEAGRWIHGHASTPCSSGSPLKGFNADKEPTASDVEWESIMKALPVIMEQCDSRSFELPWRNNIWKRELTTSVLRSLGLSQVCKVYLCQTGVVSRNNLPVGKALAFVSTSKGFSESLYRRFGTCTCVEHAPMDDVDYTRTAAYSKQLARAILRAVTQARKDP